MHLTSVIFHPDQYPTTEHYPFKLEIFRRADRIAFETPVTLFVVALAYVLSGPALAIHGLVKRRQHQARKKKARSISE